MENFDTCIRCLFHGENRREEGKFKVRCMITDDWYSEDYTCRHWSGVSRTMSRAERVERAREIRSRNFKIKIAILGSVVAILAAVITGLFMLWG